MKKGLLIVNTGDGKGKSTAAFGMVLRAWGRNFRICVIQFIKAETGQWGEIKAAKKLASNGTPQAMALRGPRRTWTKPGPPRCTAGNSRRKRSPAIDMT